MKQKINILSFILCCGALSIHAQSKPYLNRVWEYCPAPGQFVHELPAYTPGDDADTMAEKCLDNLYNDRLVSLGGYGGYITVGFDHPILNIKGSYDLLIYGNATRFGNSSEPGIVLVMTDENGNGLPDDTWYELAGSEYNNPGTIHQYQITYTRPEKENQDVTWTDNQGNTGVIQYMGAYHPHAHYPQWIKENTLTFKGSRLPDNGVWDEENGIWAMKPWAYGYVDNLYGDEGCSFDLDWAVDEQGNPVGLQYIDFVRIYTAVNQQVAAGVGELSTEIADVRDLHPEATTLTEKSIENKHIYCQGSHLNVNATLPTLLLISDLQGNICLNLSHQGGSASYPLPLPTGIYIVKAGDTTTKIAIQK